MLKEIVSENTVALPDFMATRLAYDERDALFYTLLPLMLRRGKVALMPKLLDKMNCASGPKVTHFNRFMARLIKIWSVQQ